MGKLVMRKGTPDKVIFKLEKSNEDYLPFEDDDTLASVFVERSDVEYPPVNGRNEPTENEEEEEEDDLILGDEDEFEGDEDEFEVELEGDLDDEDIDEDDLVIDTEDDEEDEDDL